MKNASLFKEYVWLVNTGSTYIDANVSIYFSTPVGQKSVILS